MLDVEHGVEIEIAPLLRAEAEPAKPGGGRGGAVRRGQLDHPERADRMPGVAAGRRHPGHRIGEREALPDGFVDLGLELEALDQEVEHRPVHALGIAAAHLVPVIAGEFELGPGRHPDLGIGEQILEPGFARRFLAQEPAHLVAVRLLGEPREERVVLAGPALAQGLEPGDEAVRDRSALRRPRRATSARSASRNSPSWRRIRDIALLRRPANRRRESPARAAHGSSGRARAGNRR